MYTDTVEMLKTARKNGYAVGAFNFDNMEMAVAIVAAAEKCGAPVILQTTPLTVSQASPEMFRAIAYAAAQSVTGPVACHLDHGDSVALAMRAVDAGYSSVMIDGSRESFRVNAELAATVKRYCSRSGIPVEAELGRVGGKEDSLVSAGDLYTDPAEAAEFVKITGVDSLAVAIGTAHGVYSGTPVLDTERLGKISEEMEARGVGIPLVLHGASGLTDGQVRECVSRGICKVNFATELRQAYTSAIKRAFGDDPNVFDPKKYGKSAIKAVMEQTAYRIEVCGSAGKA